MYFFFFFWREVACVRRSLNLQNVISNSKIDFLGFFFCWLQPGGFITKNVCFAYWASFILTESAKNYMLNISSGLVQPYLFEDFFISSFMVVWCTFIC